MKQFREERKLVTALFADLVGSTVLAERLDPEDVWQIVGQAIARIVLLVEELGGTVKDLAGDGVMALFGAPESHEDDPERAVRAGLRIAQEIESFRATVAKQWAIEGLSVRVGIETGLVVVGAVGAGSRIEYGAIGDSVNTAARLQSVARPGGVIVGAATHRLVEPLFDWSEPHSFALKGKVEPVVAFEVTGVRAVPGQLRGLEGVRTTLAGREPELSLIQGTAEALRAGKGGALFISGEPGIGKSRMVAELREMIRRSNRGHARPLWLEGHCTPYGESFAYWPFQDLVRRWLDVTANEAEVTLRSALRQRIAGLFEDSGSAVYPYLAAVLGLELEAGEAARLSGLTADALQYETFEAIANLVRRLASPHGLALVVEDVHWAHPTSAQLLERLLPLSDSEPILIVVAARPDRDRPAWRILVEAAERVGERVRWIRLVPLAENADRELLANLIGPGTLPVELEQRVLATAEGNPFFLEELLRSMIGGGSLVRDARGWRFDRQVPLELPRTVEKVIASRIDRLAPASRDVLTAASVLGRQFELPLLEAVSGGSADLVTTLRELVRLELLGEARSAPHPEYRFAHALIQETAYQSILKRQRRDLHRRTAETIERLFADRLDEQYGPLAHHYGHAGEAQKGSEYAERAGARATARLAYEEATAHYDLAVRLFEGGGTGDNSHKCRLLLSLGEAQTRSNHLAPAMDAFRRAAEVAESLGDALALARAALGYEDALFPTRLPRDPTGGPSVTLLQAALNALGEDHALLRARVQAALGRALAFSGDEERGFEMSARSVDAARQLDDSSVLAYSLLARRVSRPGPEYLDERLAASTEMADAARHCGDREMELEAQRLRLIDLLEAGEVPAADDVIIRLVRLIEEVRQPLYLWYPTMWRTMRALVDGRFDDAAVHLERFRDEGHRWRYRDVDAVFTLQLVLLRREQGRLAEVRDLVEHKNHREGDRWLGALALLYAELDLKVEADRTIDRVAENNFAAVPQNLSRATLAALTAEACARVDRGDVARPLYDLLQPWDGRAIVLGASALCLGAASHFLGLLAATAGRRDLAVGHFEQARSMNASMGARPSLARTQYELGRTLLARRNPADHERAAGLLGEAVETARLLNMPTLVSRVLATG